MKIFRRFFFFLALSLLSGCATAPVKLSDPLFYPPPPEQPRIQYLTSFSTELDIEKRPSWFEIFIFGKNENPKIIVKPYGVTLHQSKIFVTDTVANSIEILDLTKKSFEYFKPIGMGGEWVSPTNVALSSDGRMFVADPGRGQVLIFNPGGKYLTALGSKEKSKPTDVKVFNNRLYVSDVKTRLVQVYDLSNYSLLHSIPAEGEGKEAALYSPTNMDIDSAGNVYVSDTGSFDVKKYSPDGKWLKTYGTHGDSLGQFARNKGVAVDREGRICVTDAAFENVQIFNSEGKLLLYFPEKNDAASLVLPAGIDIDYENMDYFKPFIKEGFEVEYLIFIVNQYGDRKVSVFAFGKNK